VDVAEDDGTMTDVMPPTTLVKVPTTPPRGFELLPVEVVAAVGVLELVAPVALVLL